MFFMRHSKPWIVPFIRRRECRLIPIASVISLVFCGSVSAADFQTAIQGFSTNQRNVKTFVGTGTLTIEMKSVSDGALQKRLDFSIAAYMKYPDLFKLAISGTGSTTMVQKGNEMSQKVSGTDTVFTSKVDKTSDLFAKYFGYGIVESSKSVQVIGQETVVDKGVQLTRFVLKPSDRGAVQSANTPGITIDRSEMDFDANSMPVRIALFSGEKTVAITRYAYKKVGSIWVAETIATDTTVGGVRVVNTIHYAAQSVNVVVSDHVFELR